MAIPYLAEVRKYIEEHNGSNQTNIECYNSGWQDGFAYALDAVLKEMKESYFRKGELTMTNEELIKNVRRAYDKRKAEILKDMHDYNYWELYMRYELCEWLETIVNEYADNYGELIDYLKQKNYPLEWLYAVMLDREDSIWDEMSDAMDYTMKWEKEHGYDK